MKPFSVSHTPIDPIGKIEAAFLVLAEEALHDRRLGTAIADHDDGRGVKHRPDQRNETWIERVSLASSVFVGILFRPPVKPDDLALAVDVELVVIGRAAIHFMNVANVLVTVS